MIAVDDGPGADNYLPSLAASLDPFDHWFLGARADAYEMDPTSPFRRRRSNTCRCLRLNPEASGLDQVDTGEARQNGQGARSPGPTPIEVYWRHRSAAALGAARMDPDSPATPRRTVRGCPPIQPRRTT